jgi:hypothetical protein
MGQVITRLHLAEPEGTRQAKPNPAADPVCLRHPTPCTSPTVATEHSINDRHVKSNHVVGIQTYDWLC